MAQDIDLRSRMTPAPNVKVMINLGACLDIPTGHYIQGRRGESILNGGLGFITGIVGIGNNFKSTIDRFMMLTAMARMNGSPPWDRRAGANGSPGFRMSTTTTRSRSTTV